MSLHTQDRIFAAVPTVACSKRSDSGERCEVKIAIKSRGGLGREVSLSPSLAFIFFALLFTSHRSPLSERLEQAIPTAVPGRDYFYFFSKLFSSLPILYTHAL